MSIGKRFWAIAEGYIPPSSTGGGDRRFLSHETACLLNAGDAPAHVEFTLYFSDREPVGLTELAIGRLSGPGGNAPRVLDRGGHHDDGRLARAALAPGLELVPCKPGHLIGVVDHERRVAVAELLEQE